MKLLFVADPLESFKTYKDSTFAMMREAARRGHTLMACEPKDLLWQRGEPVTGFVRDISLTGLEGDGHSGAWFSAAQQHAQEPRKRRPQPLKDVDAVLMRKDPPFDQRVLLRHPPARARPNAKARASSTSLRRLRDHPEKLAILEFPQFIGPTLVTRRRSRREGVSTPSTSDIILKPLDGMGGMGIFRVGARRPEPGLASSRP